jgi:hypothetical protein
VFLVGRAFWRHRERGPAQEGTTLNRPPDNGRSTSTWRRSSVSVADRGVGGLTRNHRWCQHLTTSCARRRRRAKGGVRQDPAFAETL